MKIKIDRHSKLPNYTISKLTIDGEYFCDALEDTVRDLGKNGEGKIKAKTAIPSGTYQIIRTMSPRFKRMLPLLLNVPFFEGIRIHSGNNADDTEGCILVGINTKQGWVSDSKRMFAALDEKIERALANGEKVEIEVA